MSTLTTTGYNNCNIPGQNEFRKKLEFSSRSHTATPCKQTWKEGQMVYVPDAHQVWTRGTVAEVLEGHLVVQTATKTKTVLACDAVLLPTDEDFHLSSDLISISPMSPPAVLESLWRRYEKSEIYTWAGRTLVAFNPFRDLPHLYGTATIADYHKQYIDINDKGPPHVYGVAARAHSNMQCQGFQPNQSIIVSGESGAGKTVSAKHLMKYLVTVANHSPIGEDSFGCEIERRILNSNPILEAFGNAGTLRNENSSRFGKYIEIQFDRLGHVSGAKIQTYLLEKTRVVHQTAGEFTFHIFYQMLAGLSAEDVQRYGLHRDLLGNRNRAFEEDANHWRKTKEALNSLQVTGALYDNLFRVLAAILLLNKTEITEDEEDEDICVIKATDENMALANQAADLLQVDLGALETALTHRRITASHARRKSIFSKPCTAVEAAGRRDCLSKLLYNQVFEWLVSVINCNIHTKDVCTTIGLLDIYGFESFATNSLEQLCINYANERLQQHYVGHFLRDQQLAYQEEAVPWLNVTYDDNLPCLHLLEGVPGEVTMPGLFSLINEECQVTRPGGDHGLCERLVGALGGGDSAKSISGTAHGHSPPGTLGVPKQSRGAVPGFVVSHYAAPVTYSASGLLDKNKDNIPPELLELLQKSINPLTKDLFTSFELDVHGKKKKTVLAKFKSSLDQLMQALTLTQPHYIRCIKPSASSLPNSLDPVFVHEQLSACGIYQTVEVNRRGYPTRIPYEKFLQQYSLVLRSMPDESNQLAAAQDQCNKENELLFDPLEMLYQKQLKITPRRTSTTPKRRLRRRAGLSSCDHTRKLTASILLTIFGREFATNPTAFCQFGISKLFLRDGKLEQLEAGRLRFAAEHVYTIQCAWRRYQCRKRQRRHEAATTIQLAWRGLKERKHYCKVLNAVHTLQKALRQWQAKKLMLQTPSKCSSPDSLSGSEFFTPREESVKVSESEFFTPAAINFNNQSDTEDSSDSSVFANDGNVTFVENEKDQEVENFNTPKNQKPPIAEPGILLYSSPRSHNALQSPIVFPTIRPGCMDDTLKNHERTMDSSAAYVVCQEQDDNSVRVYHIVQSPRAGVHPEPASHVLRRVAASISATWVSQWRFNMAGAFAGIPYLETQSGILSRRRMPRVQIKFHTRANPILQGAHLISHQEFQCSLSDCLY